MGSLSVLLRLQRAWPRSVLAHRRTCNQLPLQPPDKGAIFRQKQGSDYLRSTYQFGQHQLRALLQPRTAS